MQLGGNRVFLTVEVSCLESSSSFGFDCIEFGLNSGFVRESDFFELVDEVVEFAVVCDFRNFWEFLVDWAAFETA